MARARNIKPGFFTNEELVELPFSTRLLFIGLWTLADREGRLEDRPKRIRAQVFPYDEGLDINAMMDSLVKAGFVIRYTVDGSAFAQIVNFTKHQSPHHKEVASEIPPPPGMDAVTRHAYAVSAELRNEVFARDGCACLKCGAKQDLSIDHIVPLANGGDNSFDNLQTLCTKCNASKGDTTKDYRKANVESSMNQRKSNDGASCPTDSLIPDSLNLNPESLITTTDASAPAAGGGDGRPGPDDLDPPAAAPMPPQQPLPGPTSPAGAMAALLRPLGVSATSMHPTVLEWAERGVSAEVLTEAIRIAREHKGNERIPLGYLQPIVDRLLNPVERRAAQRPPGQSQKFNFAGVDRSADVAAMQAGLAARGVTAADLDDDSPL